MKKTGENVERPTSNAEHRMADGQMTPLAAAIAEQLRQCIGAENAISGPGLELALKRPDREIRRVISKEYIEISREAGGLLCTKPGVGFWVTTDVEEIIARHRRILCGLEAYQNLETEFKAALKGFGLDGILQMERKAA